MNFALNGLLKILIPVNIHSLHIFVPFNPSFPLQAFIVIPPSSSS
jgi:hypothetical protein